jgi:excisionase family DNA binding protein
MAKLLNISLDTAYQYSRMRDFPAYRIGRSIRIPVDKLEKWIEKRKAVV